MPFDTGGLLSLLRRPGLYEPGTHNLWQDEHISKGMLAAHLDPGLDAATRSHAFVRRSVEWISRIAPAGKYPALLDLGCGPGIYAELFHAAGYGVTGMDFSARSIEFARESALRKGIPAVYLHQDYLSLDADGLYDLAAMIYCDLGVLSPESRSRLLGLVRRALRPGGRLVFDVHTVPHYAGREERRHWEILDSGFFCAVPHVCLHCFNRYGDSMDFCDQHVVIAGQEAKSYHAWGHAFTPEEVGDMLDNAGFRLEGLYGDVAGSARGDADKTLCAVVFRP